MRTAAHLDDGQMASFQDCVSGNLADDAINETTSEPNVVKKKLCRVSKGYANSRSLLLFNGQNKTTDAENLSNCSGPEAIAREIGGDHLVEICVVRGGDPAPHTDLARSGEQTGFGQRQTNSEQTHECGKISGDNTHTLKESRGDQKRKRVAFSEEIAIHNFEVEEDMNEELNCENLYDNDTGELPENCSTSEPNPDNCTYEEQSSIAPTSQLSLPKKMVLRRLFQNHVARMSNKATLFRSHLRDSFRKPNPTPRVKKPLTRSKSLQDASVRYNFVTVEDNGGTHVQLVIPLGQHYMLNSILVTISGDGKKIKVSATHKKIQSGPSHEGYKLDYHECFCLPKAVNQLFTKATVSHEGSLTIEAPFCIQNPLSEPN